MSIKQQLQDEIASWPSEFLNTVSYTSVVSGGNTDVDDLTAAITTNSEPQLGGIPANSETTARFRIGMVELAVNCKSGDKITQSDSTEWIVNNVSGVSSWILDCTKVE